MKVPHPPKKSKNLKKREYENETNAEASHFYGSIHVTTEVSSGCWQLVVDEQNFPTFPPKKKKSGKTIPPPTTHFSWASFSSTSPLCIENAVIVASCLHALCSHVHHITSHRIGYPGLPIFFFCTTMQLHRNLSTNVYYVCPSCILGLFHTRYRRLVRH